MISSFIGFVAIIFSLILGLGSPTNLDNTVLKKPAVFETKGIYLTAYTAGAKDRRQQLVDLIKKSELNSIVIDLKDYSGKVFFDTKNSLANKIGSKEVRIHDLPNLVKQLKEEGIYTIARIVVFQDPYLAEKQPSIALKNKQGGIWRDYKGLSWVDPTVKTVWKYNLDLAKEAAEIGFDEINFDYIRFPSDGSIKQIAYANMENTQEKSGVVKDFFRYLNKTLAFYPVRTSADLFGMVLWRSDGLNIGQRLEDAINNFDYICPMVYPSHYPPDFEGFANPAEHPYEIVYRSLILAKDKLDGSKTKLRPWLQDFNLGAQYTPEMIRLQKQATYDASGYGWLLWNASNNYTADGLEVDR